jgi:signal transduction histidine kinase
MLTKDQSKTVNTDLQPQIPAGRQKKNSPTIPRPEPQATDASEPAPVVQPETTARWIDALTSDRFDSGRLKPWQAYLFAVVATAATLGLRLAMDAPLEGQPMLVIFTIPIMLSAYLGGLRAGLLATALSYLAASYFLLPPFRSFGVESGADRWQQFFVTLAGVVISVLNAALHHARRRSDLAAHSHEVAEERMRAAFKETNDLRTELEERVVERTAQLEAANKELEAFSYSVSHDLRTPLRAIDGFSQALVEDYGPQLPEEGRRYLRTIREGAQRMGALIDDLLTFSRLSRQPVKKQLIDTTDLVQATLEELDSQRQGRQIDVQIGDLPACEGDPMLLKQVWINLLANAMKYTRKRDSAIIEIGCTRQRDEAVYFVRDNGTGFDMRYADKLFGVFQRLHRVEEYEGTGVGLAIVQRIIHRHGGRVWADAAVDRGATFYFTIEGTTKQ